MSENIVEVPAHDFLLSDREEKMFFFFRDSIFNRQLLSYDFLGDFSAQFLRQFSSAEFAKSPSSS